MNEVTSSSPLMSTSSAPVVVPTIPMSMLSMNNITKRFPGVVANSGVSFDVRAGEVHALLGENGAGKTTLMNILYGLYQSDEGEIRLRGEVARFRSPKDAMNKGIGLVAQHFHLARRHTVAENIGLGLRGVPFFFPTKRLEQHIGDLGKKYRLAVDPNALVWQLSPGEQQRVEILKALIQGANILILDEPTSVLTPQEAESLFEVVARMRDAGEAIIFISHKLDEVMAIADRITVLRKGAVVGTLNKSEASPSKLAQMMVGRDMPNVQRKGVKPSGPVALKLSDVWAKSERGVDALRGVNLEIKRGEILGVAGVAGNGQAELIEVLTGLRQVMKGSITLNGNALTALNAKGLFEAGVAHIPEDRNHMGVVPSMSVAENMVLRQYRYKPFTKAGLLDWNAVKNFAEKSIKEYEVSTPSKDTLTRLLSGGNVQKVILARELSGEPKLVVAAHPTYGLDVSATALTHELLFKQRERAAAVLLVSEDLDELFKLSDRIAVMFVGQVVAVVDTESANREEIGLMMAGSKVAA
jgi:general nucleoside transport system ATP-binding protein